jgi:Dickkopf-like protein
MRRSIFGFGGACVVALLLSQVLGCGSNGGAGSANGFVNELCELYRPCCAAAGLRADGVQCRAFYGAFTSAGSYDAAAGEACLTAMRAASSQPDFCDGNAEPAACDAVFGTSSGTKAPGQTCDFDDDCAPSAQGEAICGSAFPSGGGEIRKCQILVRGTAGSTPCIRTVEGSTWSSSYNGDDVPLMGYSCNVADGVRCDSLTDTCVALTPVGGDCLTSSQCVREATCSSATDTCAARAPVGSACGLDSDCVKTAYCSDPGGLCTARSANGTACTDDNQCVSDSCVNMKCAASTDNFALALLCGNP